MTRTKLGLLGLCAMVFGLMAFTATAAHAEVGAKWLVLKSAGVLMTQPEVIAAKIPAGLEVELNAEKKPINIPILHSKISGIAVLFECEEMSTKNVILGAEGSIPNGAQIVFGTCRTKLNGVTSPPCEPVAEGKLENKGKIFTAPGHALLVLHELTGGVKDDLLKILPDDVGGKPSEIFAFIEMGEECSIGTKVSVIGKATLKDCENLALTHLVKHLAEIGPLTELWTISKTAEHVATILGSGWGFLNGTGVGLAWDGDPA